MRGVTPLECQINQTGASLGGLKPVEALALTFVEGRTAGKVRKGAQHRNDEMGKEEVEFSKVRQEKRPEMKSKRGG